MTSLRFLQPLAPPPGGAVPLRFGATGEVDPPIEIPDVGSALHAGVATPWRRAGAVEASVLAVAWRRAASVSAALASLPWRGAAALEPALRSIPWQRAAALAAAVVSVPLTAAAPVAVGASIAASDAAHAGRVLVVPWGYGSAEAASTVLPWGRGTTHAGLVAVPWRAPNRATVAVGVPHGLALAAAVGAALPWQTGAGVYSEGGPWAIPVDPGTPGPTPCYVPPDGGLVELRFVDRLRGFTALLFACRHAATVVVPVREVYMVTNVTTLTRVSDGAVIPTLAMSLSLDMDSWAWGFNASLPADALALIEPPAPGEPIVLQASINGTAVRVAVEGISRERTYGQSSVRVTGRGLSAALADPYYPVGNFTNASALTSQQLVDQAMPSGWSVDWGLTAWLVPAGVWQHLGTPMSAALAVATAGGGYVQPHNTAQQIRILPRYPLAPWDWPGATPDIEIPSSVAQREGVEWRERPVYNRVYVSGVSAGYLGRVTRTGTAGDLVAPMVADPLITHVDAVRQRGLPVLADTGRKAWISLRMPVLSEIGLVMPGRLVRYVDGATTWVGMSRSLAVDVQFGQAWQVMQVETQVGW